MLLSLSDSSGAIHSSLSTQGPSCQPRQPDSAPQLGFLTLLPAALTDEGAWGGLCVALATGTAHQEDQAGAQTRFILRKPQASRGLQTGAATVLAGGRTTSAHRGPGHWPPVPTAQGQGP